MSKPNLLAIWAKHERGEGATNGELGHLIERFESLQDRLEQAERDLVVVRESQKKIAKQFAAMGTEKGKAEWRARETEAAVARVREVAAHLKDIRLECILLNDLTRALDGDTRD